MFLENRPLHDRWVEMVKQAAESGFQSAIPWTTAEKDRVVVAVKEFGSNHADDIFKACSTKLHPERTQQQLASYLDQTFGKDDHRQNKMQEAATFLRYVAIQLI